MNDYQDSNLLDFSQGDILMRFIEIGMGVLLFFMPFAFGISNAWSEEIVFLLVATLSILCVVRWIMNPQAQFKGSWLYIPILLVLLLVAFQLLVLPSSFIKAISPHTVAIKTQYLSDLANADTLLGRMCLTFYPHGTLHDLRVLWTVAALFVIVLNTYHRSAQIKRLLTTIAAAGGGVAILAILQIISRTNQIYWMYPIRHAIADAGPFVNHSHFSQFMNLSIGAALARLLVDLQENLLSRKHITIEDLSEYFRSPYAKIFWLLIGAFVLGMAAIFLSMSRGGMITFLIAGSFTVVMITLKQRSQSHGKIIAILALLAFVCILYIGFDAVYDRLGSLHDMDKGEGGRWQIIKDITSAWTRFPLFGTGLGTHMVVYPMFDRSTIPALASHAENEYAQTMEETGILGFILLLTWIIGIWIAYTKGIRKICRPIQMATFGLGMGFLAINLHSFSDFGQHLPAISSLTAITGALLIVLSRISGANDHSTTVPQYNHTTRLSLGIPALVILMAIWTSILISADHARIGEMHWIAASASEAFLEKNQWQGGDEQFIDLVSRAGQAAEAQPNNIHYQHWLNTYRWRMISRTVDPNTGGIILLPETLEFTKQIINELHQARPLCPTYGPILCVAGQLEQIIFNDPLGFKHIEMGYELAPCDAVTCYMAGVMDAEQGRIEEAQAKFSRATELNGGLFDDIASFCILSLGDAKLALRLAGENIGRLNQIARILGDFEEEGDLLQNTRKQIMSILLVECSKEDARPYTFVSLARLQWRSGTIEEAMENYEEALIRNYNNVYWRYEYARLLAEQNQLEKAIHEARICLRLRSDYDPAKRLIAKLSVLPAAVSE